MKKFVPRTEESSISAIGQEGLKLFLDHLKYKLHLLFVSKEFGVLPTHM